MLLRPCSGSDICPPKKDAEEKEQSVTEIIADIQAAWARRAALHDNAETNTYRLFHGYTEGCAGLDIERYGEAVLVRSKGELPVAAADIEAGLDGCHPFRWLGLKVQRRHSTHPVALEVVPMRGPLPEAPIEVIDNGMTFAVEPFDHESTGLFLDARPVRRWLLEHSRGRRVLNLFAYTGSLGVAAAVGGATEVVHVDLRGSALDRARENHRRNRVECDGRNFVRGNVYAHLPRAARAGQLFDGIILDPPPEMTRGRRKKRIKHQDYPKLARLCAPLLAEGGWLVCLFHRWDQTRDAYEKQVCEHAGVPLELMARGTSGEDFPERDAEAKMRYSVFRRG